MYALHEWKVLQNPFVLLVETVVVVVSDQDDWPVEWYSIYKGVQIKIFDEMLLKLSTCGPQLHF